MFVTHDPYPTLNGLNPNAVELRPMYMHGHVVPLQMGSDDAVQIGPDQVNVTLFGKRQRRQRSWGKVFFGATLMASGFALMKVSAR